MHAQPLNVFIGFDSHETVAYHVAAHSLMTQSSVPVTICPIIRGQVPLNRERQPNESTEFSFSRFLVPWLMGYQGKAVFMDCDVLVDCDIKELFDAHYMDHAVSVVQHDYTPKTKTKFLGNEQSVYPKKNWSSVMVFNCGHPDCHKLTPESVSRESGAYLHQFQWTDAVGSLDPAYNHLVGEYDDDVAKIYHYTLGTPCFREYRDCDKSGLWHKSHREMNSHW